MRKKPIIIAFIIFLTLSVPSLASNVYIGNQPYEGRVTSGVAGVEFVLSELAEALNYEVQEFAEGWILGGLPVATKEREDLVWIELSALPKDLVRVMRSPELNVIDLYKERRSVTTGVVPRATWGGVGTLVYFYSDDSYPCLVMESAIAALEQSNTIRVERLNIYSPDSAVYRKYVRLFEGDKIPFYLLLDSRERKLDSFSGILTYPDLIDRLNTVYSR